MVMDSVGPHPTSPVLSDDVSCFLISAACQLVATDHPWATKLRRYQAKTR